MKIELLGIISAALLVLAVVSEAATKPERTILFGVNYLPHATCNEDFSPYWKTDNWTEKRMVTDMKIIKAIGCSCVRFHIMPALPIITESSGISAEKYLRMIDLGVQTAQDLGLKFHLDLDTDPGIDSEKVVRYCMSRYKGKIESYQTGNERWDFPQKPDTLKWLEQMVALAHSVDSKAKVSTDMLATDWTSIRDNQPDLYKMLDFATVHYYPVTDYHGWNQLYIDDLVDYLSNPTGRKSAETIPYRDKVKLKDFGVYDAKAKSFDHDLYVGSFGSIDKDIWISEIASHGYWRWGNLTPEDKRAEDWKRVVDAVAGAKNRVTRIYHHCFRDKMSWREFGQGQSGIVYYDGAPRAATMAFKEMAEKYAPADSAMRDIDCTIQALDGFDYLDGRIAYGVFLTNKTSTTLKGKAVLELPDGLTADATSFEFTLSPKKSERWTVVIDTNKAHWGNNHCFVRVTVPHGFVYGWWVIPKPKTVEVDKTAKLDDKPSPVRYVQGMDAVQEFFAKYGDDCAIVTGRCVGMEMEMAYRLKSVLQAERCHEIPMRSSILAQEVLNRPLIVIGSPTYNQIARAIEMGLPEDQRITAANPGAGKGVINVVQAPFGALDVNARFSPQCEFLGYYFGGCTAALYIAGPDDEGTRAAAYDLILRIWGKEEKYR